MIDVFFIVFEIYFPGNIPDPTTKDPQVISVRRATTTDGPSTKGTTEVKSTTKAVPTTAATNKTTSTEVKSSFELHLYLCAT